LFAENEEVIQADLELAPILQRKPVVIEDVCRGTGVEPMVFVQRHAVGKVHATEEMDNVIDEGRWYRDDNSSARAQQPVALTSQRFLVSNMFQGSQQDDRIKGSVRERCRLRKESS